MDRKKVTDAIAQFPATFGLRAFPGQLFRLEPSLSYTSGDTVYLYTSIQEGNTWSAFCKGTPAELRSQIVEVKL